MARLRARQQGRGDGAVGQHGYSMRHSAGEVAEISCFRGEGKVVQMVDEDTAVVILRFTGGGVGEVLAIFGQTVGPYGQAVILCGRGQRFPRADAVLPQLSDATLPELLGLVEGDGGLDAARR